MHFASERSKYAKLAEGEPVTAREALSIHSLDAQSQRLNGNKEYCGQ